MRLLTYVRASCRIYVRVPDLGSMTYFTPIKGVKIGGKRDRKGLGLALDIFYFLKRVQG